MLSFDGFSVRVGPLFLYLSIDHIFRTHVLNGPQVYPTYVYNMNVFGCVCNKGRNATMNGRYRIGIMTVIRSFVPVTGYYMSILLLLVRGKRAKILRLCHNVLNYFSEEC